MRLKFQVHLVVLISVILLQACDNKKPAGENKAPELKTPYSPYKVHTDTANGFSIEYPKAWDSIAVDQRFALMVLEVIRDTADRFNEGFNINISPNEGLTLDKMADANVAYLKKFYGNAKIGRREFTTVNGLACIQLSLSLERDSLQLINFITFFDNGTHLYTITHIAELEKSAIYKPYFDHTVNSFRWLKNNPVP